jgi:molecular chaperone GrpE
MANSNGQKEPQDGAAPEAQNSVHDKEPVVSKPYVMPDDPEEGSVEALTKDVAEAKDRMLRTLAEMEDLRKRTARK